MDELARPTDADTPDRGSALWTGMRVIGGLTAFLWFVEIVDTAIFDDRLQRHGIEPRDLDGLEGIVLAPLLHDDFGHLLANTVPFIVLGLLLLLYGLRRFVTVTLAVTLAAGACVWLFARSANHIGASIVIFGYFGYLVATGLFQRSMKSIVIALFVGLVYGGLIWGVLPTTPGVSWEGHLFGFLAGVGTAWTLSRRPVGGRHKHNP